MLGKKMRDLMNEQIKNELESYYIYLSMVAYFHSRNLDGMAHWMRCQAHEEMIHAMKFYDHIIDRGGTVELLNLKQLKTKWKSPLEAWQDTLEHEKFITAKIHDLVKLSRKENDIASDTLLNWFSKEQIEEESNAEKVLRQMEMIGDSKQGIYLLDRDLATRIFPAGSPLDPAAYNLAT
jgi:ferritin